MRPIRTPFTNRVFKLPGGTEENDLPLEATTWGEDEVLISTWELTEADLINLKHSPRIELVVWGKGHPPVLLRTLVDIEG